MFEVRLQCLFLYCSSFFEASFHFNPGMLPHSLSTWFASSFLMIYIYRERQPNAISNWNKQPSSQQIVCPSDGEFCRGCKNSPKQTRNSTTQRHTNCDIWWERQTLGKLLFLAQLAGDLRSHHQNKSNDIWGKLMGNHRMLAILLASPLEMSPNWKTGGLWCG